MRTCLSLQNAAQRYVWNTYMIPIPTGEKMCKKKSLPKITFLSVPSDKGDIEAGKKDNDQLDTDLKQPVIKMVSNAEDIAEQLKDFAEFVGH